MLKLKKTESGMTLVEVVVAMAMFSVTTLSVTMALAAVVKYNARNIRRDSELTVQQTAIEQGTVAGVKAISSAYAGDTIKFTSDKVNVTVDGITEYEALKTAHNSDEFNFQVKTFSSTVLGSRTVVFAEEDEFKLEVVNLSSNDYSVTLTANSGEIYEGNYDTTTAGASFICTVEGYTTTSGDVKVEKDDGTTASTAPSGFEVGYKAPTQDDGTIVVEDDYVYISITKDGDSTSSYSGNIGSYFTGTNGVCSIVIKSNGSVEVTAS